MMLRMRKTILVGLLVCLVSAAPAALAAEGDLPLTPWPRSVERGVGEMRIAGGGRIITNDKALTPLADVLAEEVLLTTGVRMQAGTGPGRAGDIVLERRAKLQGDNHKLVVSDRATITAGTYNAAALGTATLIQLLKTGDGGVTAPRVAIDDGPQIAYCAAMLDIARRYYPIESLKQAVRIARFYKIRYIQLHMTDDQAWMFPSTAFPQLGKHNAQLDGSRKPAYSLAELRELVAFADARGVTLVPELEAPGHSGQLRGTLPEIFNYKHEGKFLTQETINMVGERSYEALDKIIGEMSQVFKSSPFFHVGFDEYSISGLETLDEVKEFLAKHRMTGGHEVLNYFQNRVQEIVRKHGKRMSAYDGVLGPVAPKKDLIVTVWAPGGGAEVFTNKGYAINQMPWSPPGPYFDPHNVSGVNLKHGDPLMHGAIAPLWEAGPEQMIPVLRNGASLRNEPAWNPQCKRGLADFLLRQRATEGKLDRLLAGFTFEMKGIASPLTYLRVEPMFEESVVLNLVGARDPSKVHFTVDGSEPTEASPRWAGPLTIERTTVLKARYIAGDAPKDALTLVIPLGKAPTVKTSARGATVTVSPQPGSYYGPGPQGMTDGLLGAQMNAGAPGWIGWNATPVELVIDQGKAVEVSSLSVHCMRADYGVEMPGEVAYSISDDGKAFTPLATVERAAGAKANGWFTATVPPESPVKARYIKAVCTPLPGAHWIFIDEFAVNAPVVGPNFRHAAVGKPVSLENQPHEIYMLPGVEGMTDGRVGGTADFLNPQWIGIDGKNFVATIDLGAATAIRRVGANFMRYARVGVYVPVSMEVSVSDDGKTFRSIGSVKSKQEAKAAVIETLAVDVKDVKARYVRVTAPTNGLWIFADEVFVNPQ